MADLLANLELDAFLIEAALIYPDALFQQIVVPAQLASINTALAAKRR